MATGERRALSSGDVRIPFDPLPMGVADHQSLGRRQSLWPRSPANPALQRMCQGAFAKLSGIDTVLASLSAMASMVAPSLGPPTLQEVISQPAIQLPRDPPYQCHIQNRRTYDCAHHDAIPGPYRRLWYGPVGVSTKAVVSRPRCPANPQVDLGTR